MERNAEAGGAERCSHDARGGSLGGHPAQHHPGQQGLRDSDVTRWWNFTRHRELDDQTVAEAWEEGRYTDVSRLIQSLPDTHFADDDADYG